ncbi:UNVERIFIED_CONTAM: hypothetical protein FKN15_000468 [Acipenser sinensis]
MAFMKQTVELGIQNRPKGLWGYYLYPDCHNYNLHEENYTGSCPVLESLRNDELFWLWNSSTALFPSIAIKKSHADSINNLHFSKFRVLESMRIASMTSMDYDLPTFVYTRLGYRDDPLSFLSMQDLIYTIGESAALGAAGFVIWGDLNLTSSRHNCSKVNLFMSYELGLYITNVTKAAEVCSEFLCQNNGRFGIYPTVNEITGDSFNGGLPQLVNLKKHYEQAKKDVEFYIPYDNELLGGCMVSPQCEKSGRLTAHVSEDSVCSSSPSAQGWLRFGIYPTVNEITGDSFNGGLPQLVNLKKHYEQAKKDVEFYIPYDNAGLAVLDLEDWRPQWVRNWAEKDIYRRYSTDLVQQRDLTLTFEEAYHVAKDEFEQAATSYFKNSLKLGKSLKHKRVWGYYLFPECYNHDYNQTLHYTGRCPDTEIERNNQLQWLWNESTALYPSIYLEIILKASPKALLFVRHRLQEAMRVAMLPNPSYSLPVYAYTQPAFKDNNTEYLSEIDYVHTFGEAAALGVSGIVQWGSLNFTKSMCPHGNC